MSKSFNLEDAGQIFVGAFALAVPISFSEEAWQLGESLPTANLALLFLLSCLFLSIYAFESVYQRNINGRVMEFISRIVIAYILTIMVVALVLLCIDKLPALDSPLVALKRVIVIAMPASMGAIIVDGFDKE
ncbi:MULTISPECIES: DUF2391 family protein [Vibrio]|uniref:DUF2391 family protein n=1 Tax=Vibrio fortis TaxID=212667 RepID=A0A5N3QTP1_9VIBR|nr:MULTISPECIES: DUF2391 family protein [Vibrio]KAB0285566.1 DUF2391 family protein [Vibrio fortis]QFT13158.1 hypothetical protein FIV04_24745 [Vibrio sp. THAF190c]